MTLKELTDRIDALLFECTADGEPSITDISGVFLATICELVKASSTDEREYDESVKLVQEVMVEYRPKNAFRSFFSVDDGD